MDVSRRAREVAAAIEQARSKGSTPSTRVAVSIRDAWGARVCGVCTECGYRFNAEVWILDHPTQGRRSISERSVHYLSHGMARHETGHRLFDEPVFAEIEVEEWAGYLGLDQGA